MLPLKPAVDEAVKNTPSVEKVLVVKRTDNEVTWNKNKDIKNSLDFIAYNFKNKNANLLTFEDAYHYYWKFAVDHIYTFIVSKKYFETYLQIHIPKYIIYEKFIINDWLDNLHN